MVIAGASLLLLSFSRRCQEGNQGWWIHGGTQALDLQHLLLSFHRMLKEKMLEGPRREGRL